MDRQLILVFYCRYLLNKKILTMDHGLLRAALLRDPGSTIAWCIAIQCQGVQVADAERERTDTIECCV